MAKKVYEESNIKAIADKIREKTGGEETYKTNEMPVGIDAVYEAGQKAEYDRFWDNYQQNGNRTNYTNGFGLCWTKSTFKPKYSMKPTTAYMFLRYAPLGSIDLVEHFDKLGVTLDFSNCTNAQYAFYGAHISRLGVMDLRKIKGASADGVFSSTSLKTIDLLKVSEEQTNLNWFSDASALENITIEGVIAADLKLSKSSLLTHDSLMSIINALKDFAEKKTVWGEDGCIVTGYWNDHKSLKFDVLSASLNGTTLTCNCSKEYWDGTVRDGITFTAYNINIGEEDLPYIKTIQEMVIDCGENDDGTWWFETTVEICIEKTPTTTKTLTLHADAKSRLTEDELKIATDKGWNVV